MHVLHEFYDPFKELLDRAGDEMLAVHNEPSDVACSECQKLMVYRWSKTGRFLACSGYPKCKTTLNVDREGRPIILEESEHVCELCNKKMIHRQSRTGHFLGCSGYPECRNTIACDEAGEPLRLVTEEELKQPCDACGDGTMVVKRKGRRSFLGCDQYPKCKNTTSLPEDVRLKIPPPAPVEEAGVACDRCRKPMVIRSGKRGKFIACSGFPRCRNTKPIEKLDELKAGANGAEAVDADVAKSNGKKKYSPDNNGEPPPGFAWTRTGRPVVETMPEENTLNCPNCGDIMTLKRGRFGPFFSCAAFPRCKFVSNLRGEAKKKAEELMPAPVRPKPEPSGIPCGECGKEMLIRQGRRGKFLGCGGYPKCTHTMELPAEVAG